MARRKTERRARGRRKLAEPELAGDELPVQPGLPVQDEPPRRKALTPTEEQDDFEDGRTQGGLYSREEEDLAARGDVGSRRFAARSGPYGVEAGEPETTAPPVPKPVARASPGRGAPYVPPGGLARLRRRSRPAPSRARRRKPARRPSFGAATTR